MSRRSATSETSSGRPACSRAVSPPSTPHWALSAASSWTTRPGWITSPAGWRARTRCSRSWWRPFRGASGRCRCTTGWSRSHGWSGGGPRPTVRRRSTLLDRLGRALRRYYGHPFDSVGCNYYRTGADSVAWHGDRMRLVQVDPVVAIVSVGAPRPFLLRPRGGGPSRSFLLGHGDLLVMGGASQHDWEHAVPKVALAGPRISITYRHAAEPPAALRGRRSHHPSAGAQDRHLLATGSANGPGRLDPRGADIHQARLRAVERHTEGTPS